MKKQLPQELVGSLITLRVFEADFIPELFAIISLQSKQGRRFERPVFNTTKVFFLDSLERMSDCLGILYGIFDQQTDVLLGAIEIREPNADQGQLQVWLHDAYFSRGHYQEILQLLLPVYFSWSKRMWLNARVEASNSSSVRAHEKAHFITSDEVVVAGRLYYDMVYMLPHACVNAVQKVVA